MGVQQVGFSRASPSGSTRARPTPTIGPLIPLPPGDVKRRNMKCPVRALWLLARLPKDSTGPPSRPSSRPSHLQAASQWAVAVLFLAFAWPKIHCSYWPRWRGSPDLDPGLRRGRVAHIVYPVFLRDCSGAAYDRVPIDCFPYALPNLVPRTNLERRAHLSSQSSWILPWRPILDGTI